MDGFSDRGSIPLISILDYHVKAIVARRRDAQHIPRIDWVCAFSFLIHLYRKNKQYVCKKVESLWLYLFL